MKKKIIATVILNSFFGVAHADDGNSVTLYGILDVAVGMVEHSAGGNALFPPTVNPVTKVSTKFSQPVYGMWGSCFNPISVLLYKCVRRRQSTNAARFRSHAAIAAANKHTRRYWKEWSRKDNASQLHRQSHSARRRSS
jgi:hypothetical protein